MGPSWKGSCDLSAIHFYWQPVRAGHTASWKCSTVQTLHIHRLHPSQCSYISLRALSNVCFKCSSRRYLYPLTGRGGEKKSSFGKMNVETFFRCCLVVTGGCGAFQNGWHCCMVIGPQCLGSTVQVRVTIRWNSGEADPGIPLATVSACDRRCSFRPSLSVVPRSCWKMPKAASWQSLHVYFALFACGVPHNAIVE